MEKVAKNAATPKGESKVEEAIDYQVESGDQLNFVRLKLGGGDVWLIQLDGSVEGIDYTFNLAKMVKIVSQITKRTVLKEDEKDLRYFTYAVVVTAEGTSLKLPLSEGLYLTHYNRYCDAEGKINPTHSMDDLRISFTVSYETKNGKTLLDDQGRPKKIVGNVKYEELVVAEA